MEHKKIYDVLVKKYSLPQYDLMVSEFDIDTLDISKGSFLKQVLFAIKHKLDDFIDLVTPLLQPDSSCMVCITEYKHFEESDRAKMQALLVKMMIIKRDFALVSLVGNEKKIAEFIKSTVKVWPSIKTEIIAIVSKMKESWMIEAEPDERMDYMG